MNKMNKTMVALFAGAAVVGSLLIGVGVFAQTATTTLNCSDNLPSVNVGQQMTLSATGGDGVNYVWSSPSLAITNPTGAQFMVAFNTAGVYPVTVMSAGQSATCSVVVTSSSPTGTGLPAPVTPGLPNTGAMPE